MKKKVFVGALLTVSTLAIVGVMVATQTPHSSSLSADSPVEWHHYHQQTPSLNWQGKAFDKGTKEYWVQCGGGYQYTTPTSGQFVYETGAPDKSEFAADDDRWLTYCDLNGHKYDELGVCEYCNELKGAVKIGDKAIKNAVASTDTPALGFKSTYTITGLSNGANGETIDVSDYDFVYFSLYHDIGNILVFGGGNTNPILWQADWYNILIERTSSGWLAHYKRAYEKAWNTDRTTVDDTGNAFASILRLYNWGSLSSANVKCTEVYGYKIPPKVDPKVSFKYDGKDACTESHWLNTGYADSQYDAADFDVTKLTYSIEPEGAEAVVTWTLNEAPISAPSNPLAAGTYAMNVAVSEGATWKSGTDWALFVIKEASSKPESLITFYYKEQPCCLSSSWINTNYGDSQFEQVLFDVADLTYTVEPAGATYSVSWTLNEASISAPSNPLALGTYALTVTVTESDVSTGGFKFALFAIIDHSVDAHGICTGCNQLVGGTKIADSPFATILDPDSNPAVPAGFTTSVRAEVSHNSGTYIRSVDCSNVSKLYFAIYCPDYSIQICDGGGKSFSKGEWIYVYCDHTGGAGSNLWTVYGRKASEDSFSLLKEFTSGGSTNLKWFFTIICWSHSSGAFGMFSTEMYSLPFAS